MTQNRDGRAIIFCIAVLFFSVYLPYILHGGFIVDDWDVAYKAYDNASFSGIYGNWFPIFSNRPLAPLPLTIAAYFFGSAPMGYIILHLCLWLSFLILVTRVLYGYLGQYALVFFLLGLFPTISSTAIFSPGMQLTASFSLALWAASLNLLQFANKPAFRLAAYALLLASMLTYEITFPLFILSWYVSVRSISNLKNPLVLLRSFMPYIAIGLTIAIYQKLIIPRFMVTYSRLNFVGIGFAATLFRTWLWVLLTDLPSMLASAFFRIFSYGFVDALTLFLVCVFAGIIFYAVGCGDKEQGEKGIGIVAVGLAAFFGSSALYVFSGRYPDISGYDNRGMTCSWIALSLLVASFLWYFQKKKSLLAVAAGLYFLVACSFVVQRDQQIISSEYQYVILDDFQKTVRGSGHDLSTCYVLANIPDHPPDAFNYEVIFNVKWDFPAAVKMFYPGLVKSSVPINPTMIFTGHLRGRDGGLDVYEDPSAPSEYFPFNRTYYYEYGAHGNGSILQLVENTEQAKAVINRTISYRHWQGEPSWWDQREAVVRRVKEYFG